VKTIKKTCHLLGGVLDRGCEAGEEALIYSVGVNGEFRFDYGGISSNCSAPGSGLHGVFADLHRSKTSDPITPRTDGEPEGGSPPEVGQLGAQRRLGIEEGMHVLQAGVEVSNLEGPNKDHRYCVPEAGLRL
jgi:hypothetical protein